MLLTLFVYVNAAFGFAYIAGHSKISLPFREWIDPGGEINSYGKALRAFLLALIECPPCLGFWTGVAAYFLVPKGTIGVVTLALFTASTNFIIGRATNLIPKEEH